MLEFAREAGVTLLAWIVLMVASTNLVGIVVRGLIPNPELDEIASKNVLIASEHQKAQRTTNIFASILIIAFLSALYYFWNVGLVLAALMLMTARVPDLLWELRNGQKLHLSDMQKPKLSYIATLFSWAALPTIWYAFYQI